MELGRQGSESGFRVGRELKIGPAAWCIGQSENLVLSWLWPDFGDVYPVLMSAVTAENRRFDPRLSYLVCGSMTGQLHGSVVLHVGFVRMDLLT